MSDHTFEGNLKLAKFLANKYSFGALDNFEDMYQEACLALWQAVESYPTIGLQKGVTFSAYAAQEIVYKILKFKNQQSKFYLSFGARELRTKLVKDPDFENLSVEEISKKYKVSKQMANNVMKEMLNSKSLDDNGLVEDGGESYASTIPGGLGITITDDSVLHPLSPIERKVFMYLAGGLELKEIAQLRKVDVSGVIATRRRIRSKIGKNLKNYYVRVV